MPDVFWVFMLYVYTSQSVSRAFCAVVCFCSGSSTRTDSCATPSPAHSGTHTHNPKPQQKPTPSSSSPFIGQYYVTSSCYSLPFRVHFLCRCTRSSQSSTSPSPFRTLPQVPPPFLSLSMPPPFCPLLSQRPKAVKSDLVVRFQFSRKARYSSSAIQTKTNSVKNASEAMPNLNLINPLPF